MIDIVNLPGLYDKIQTTTSVAYGGFNTNIKFPIPQKGYNMYYVAKKSYMGVQLRIIQTRDDGLTSYNLEPIISNGTRLIPTAISIPFINNNAVVTLFDSLTTSMNDVSISDSQFLQPSNTYRIMYESKEEQQIINSTNPITPMNSYDVGTATSP